MTSVFHDSTISYPGPGKYNPKDGYSSKAYHMASKAKTTYETVSPGPKYNFESTLLDRNKILSNLKKTPGLRIMLPSRKDSRVSYTELSESKRTMQSNGILLNIQLQKAISPAMARKN